MQLRFVVVKVFPCYLPCAAPLLSFNIVLVARMDFGYRLHGSSKVISRLINLTATVKQCV
ncbi:hypothetical protein M3J09_011562 [Ascochyta lentis]